MDVKEEIKTVLEATESLEEQYHLRRCECGGRVLFFHSALQMEYAPELGVDLVTGKLVARPPYYYISACASCEECGSGIIAIITKDGTALRNITRKELKAC